MAEQVDACQAMKESKDKESNSNSTSKRQIQELNVVDVIKKPIEETTRTEKSELPIYHAQNLQQTNRSLLPFDGEKMEEKTLAGEQNESISNKNISSNDSLTVNSLDSAKVTVDDEGREKRAGDGETSSKDEEENYRIRMNNQHQKDAIDDESEISKASTSGEVVFEKSKDNLLQKQEAASDNGRSSSQKVAENQKPKEVKALSDEFNVELKQNNNKSLMTNPESTNKKASNECNHSKERDVDKNKQYKTRYEEDDMSEKQDNVLNNSKTLTTTNISETEVTDDSDIVMQDNIGEKSPTFDKFEQHATNAKSNVVIESEKDKQNDQEQNLQTGFCLEKPKEKEQEKSTAAISLENDVEDKFVRLDGSARDGEIIEKDTSKAEISVVSNNEHNINCKDVSQKSQQNAEVENNIADGCMEQGDNRHNLECSEEEKLMNNGKRELRSKKEKSSKKTGSNKVEKSSHPETEKMDDPESYKEKDVKDETSDASINGENDSSKSGSSAEDSDKSSESEVEFTKRASNDPNFAIVYSFLSLFGHLLNLPEISIDELEQCLENCNDLNLRQENHGLLEKLHLKLLRRLSRSCKSHFSSLGQVSNDRLIKYLIKFSKYVDLDLAWDLEKFGYHVLGSKERLVLLKALCEIHFDENPRFKVHFTDEYIKTDNFEALRLQPEGHDMQGKAVWYQQDNFAGFRVYSVDEDDDVGTGWKLLASTLEELDHLLENLKKKSEINPKDVALMKRKERKEKRLSIEQANKKSKKGRGKTRVTRRKKDMSESESDEEDENPCAHCFSNKRPDMVLLCDKCDAAYHTLCLRPPLLTIPEGDWLCPYCQQLELIESLQAKYKTISARKKSLERVSKRTVFDDIKVSNIVEGDADSGRAGRRRSKIDYNFTDYNQMINDAISSESKPSTEIPASNFYRAPSGRPKLRRLNDLDGDSFDSESSVYENSDSDNEAQTTGSNKGKDLAPPGCRRSRRLKRKYGDEQESESSESEEDHFVRRSSRRRKSTQKTYMEYESDDTPEEVILKKKPRAIDDSDEYVISGSDEDPEDILIPRRSRRIISDDEDEEETPDCEDDETDVDEELCEDMEKNVVSDDTEEEDVNLTPSDNDDDDDDGIGGKNVEYTTDDDDYDEDIRSSKTKNNVKERHGKKGGGKDIRNIMKSMREEKALQHSAKKEKDTDIGNTSQESESKEEGQSSDVNEEMVDDRLVENPNETGIMEDAANKKDVGIKGATIKVSAVKVEAIKMEAPSPEVANKIAEESERENVGVNETSTEFEIDVKHKLEADEDIINNEKSNNHSEEKSIDVLVIEGKDSLKEVRDKELSKIDETKEGHERNTDSINIATSLNSMVHDATSARKEGKVSYLESKEHDNTIDRKGMLTLQLENRDFRQIYEKRASALIKTHDVASTLAQFSHNTNALQDPLKASIALTSFSPTAKYPHVQPPFHPQGASPVIPMPHPSEILRPRPYAADAGRPYESYHRSANANYSPVHTSYNVRPTYESFLEQQTLFQPSMHGFSRMAPPQYPGFPTNEQQSMWQPQRYPPPMQWGYPPYRNMLPQGEPKHRVAQMHRPYLDSHSYEENPSNPILTTKSQNRSSSQTTETSRRSKTSSSSSDDRKPTVSESYAAFRNMVIAPSGGNSQKKAKRS